MGDKVALIFGYGPNVGFAIADSLALHGYKVAVVSRSEHLSDAAKNNLQIQAGLSVPSSVENIFTRVIGELGHPTVVVYNGKLLCVYFKGVEFLRGEVLRYLLASAVGVNPSAPQISQFESANNVNIVSAYVAAQFAVKSFAQLPPESPRTFIYTGNKLPLMVVQPLLLQGVGKAGAAHLIHYLAEEYKGKGYKSIFKYRLFQEFYFADERKPDGEPVYSAIDGSAHAHFYIQLAEDNMQEPWFATFVKGQGMFFSRKH
ncbi:uncharacterized protein N7477_005061 [Penicillium maclennaniae]|uniref:uncharacterized protein n=1 Tax=Penicillium maclennaniae TaxID=1343394 RepID=UPI00253FCAAA|nr:uncharacterized protein N7477_005061 [Penicillium maclennaniae]KAJ5675127.1 hypothetical protein N7477_005061 [Penicillium maclennaniae]